jgi:hypothetical protein
VYDNINEIVYITKRDYIPKRNDIKYDPVIGFYLNDASSPITITDPYSPTTGYGCPPGYTYIYPTGCTKTTVTTGNPVTSSSPTLTAANSAAYGIGGTILYNPGWGTTTGVGAYTNIGITNPLWMNNVPQATVAVATTNGKFSSGASTLMVGNYISITGTNTGTAGASFITGYISGTTYKVSSVVGNSPNVTAFTLKKLDGSPLETTIGSLTGLTYNTLVGPVNGLNKSNSSTSAAISHRIYLPSSDVKTYYVALTGYAGQSFKINLDGDYILTSDTSAMTTYLSASPESKYLHIYPVTVSKGAHTLILEGDYRGLGAMVIDNNAGQIASATSYNDLNILFSTAALTTFNIYTYPCAATLQKIPGQATFNCIATDTLSPTTTTLETFPPDPRPIIRPIKVCDSAYFDDASWTISYDVKNNQWLGFHDWHPSFMLPSKRHFLTAYNVCNISQTGLWRHNDRWDDFCNFYGTYYPFEVEYVIPTGDTVTTMKNVEYVLEAYKYGTNGQDKFHLLDYNFDEAIVYNSEQTSGQLNLKLKSKSNPFAYLQYPNILGSGSTDILFSKEEQKYRFNQFNDITKDRGEFSGAQNILTTTSPNGYIWTVNPIAVDYYKPALQRKKFRHNVGKVLLRKKAIDKKTFPTADGGIKILFKMITTKLQQSQK